MVLISCWLLLIRLNSKTKDKTEEELEKYQFKNTFYPRRTAKQSLVLMGLFVRPLLMSYSCLTYVLIDNRQDQISIKSMLTHV